MNYLSPCSRTKRAGKAAASGFTLVEMLVALAILGVIAAGTAVALKPVRDRSLIARSSAALTDLIARAHAAALREGRSVRLRFDPDRRLVTLEGTRVGTRLDPSVTLSLTTAREAATGPEQGILFLPNGTGSGGRLRLEILGSAAAARTLRVSWLTGMVVDER